MTKIQWNDQNPVDPNDWMPIGFSKRLSRDWTPVGFSTKPSSDLYLELDAHRFFNETLEGPDA